MKWSSWRDSHPRLSGYRPDTLTAELQDVKVAEGTDAASEPVTVDPLSKRSWGLAQFTFQNKTADSNQDFAISSHSS